MKINEPGLFGVDSIIRLNRAPKSKGFILTVHRKTLAPCASAGKNFIENFKILPIDESYNPAMLVIQREAPVKAGGLIVCFDKSPPSGEG